jgi:ribosome-binding protein aMBF1 (putative translation factor)
MSKTLIDNLAYGSEEMKFYLQERLILDFTEAVCEAMEEAGIDNTQLAVKLGRSKGYVTLMLDGRAALTIRQMSDIMFYLGMKAEFK